MKSTLFVIALVCFAGCSGTSGDTDTMIGEDIYRLVDRGGNTFTCATCHALHEPADDGLRRPGHPIGNATRRPSYKNGQLDNMLDAANTCRREWMGAPEWTEESQEWQALYQFLDEQANVEEAPALEFEILAAPGPDLLTGGDVEVGRDFFNGACVVCHGENATGTERAPALHGELLDAEYIGRRVRTSGNNASAIYFGLTGGRMPFWSSDRVTEQDLRDVVAFVQQNDPDVVPDGDPPDTGMLRDCASTHLKVGQTAELTTRFHNVSGTATIIDDCTIEITNFSYDGTGIVVEIFGGNNGQYGSGFSTTDNLIKPGGYSGDTIYAQLPEDKTLDDLDGLSVWCVEVGVSFGDGLFQ